MALVAKKADNTDGFELIYKSINDIQANEFHVATSIDGRQSQEFLEQTKKHLDKKAVKNQVDKLAKTTTDKVDDALKKTNKISKKFVENPFDEAGNLQPNVKFKTGEFEYFGETDEFGRLERFDTDNLQLTQRTERLPHNPNTPDKLEGDHSGHIFGDRFGGSPELDNLVSQSSKVNLSTFKKLENKWAKALNQNKKVEVEIKIKYSDDSKRSSSFEINYKIESEKYSEIIENN